MPAESVLRALRRGSCALLAVLMYLAAPASAQPAAGAEPLDLQFSSFFRQPVGPRGLELGEALRAADGRRVRLVGYRVAQESPTLQAKMRVSSGPRMDLQLAILCALTFVIHLIGTLAYAVRIAGVRTRRIAVSFALFNILVLVSRTSNSFQGPFLAKRIEQRLGEGVAQALLADFRWLLLAATLATVAGAFLIPTFQRLFSRAVLHFQIHRSISRLLMHALFKGGLAQVRDAASLPAASHLAQMRCGPGVSPWVIVLNVAAVALWTIGVFASLYAGCLNPELRVTASTLSSVVNGGATILMFVFIDPHLSVMTDDVIEGRTSEPDFRTAIVWLVGSRLGGTLLAQALLVPSAQLIAWIAKAM